MNFGIIDASSMELHAGEFSAPASPCRLGAEPHQGNERFLQRPGDWPRQAGDHGFQTHSRGLRARRNVAQKLLDRIEIAVLKSPVGGLTVSLPNPANQFSPVFSDSPMMFQNEPKDSNLTSNVGGWIARIIAGMFPDAYEWLGDSAHLALRLTAQSELLVLSRLLPKCLHEAANSPQERTRQKHSRRKDRLVREQPKKQASREQ